MLKCLVVALATALSIVSAEAADKPTLTVYTYESFVGEYGPGQALKKAFEAKCGCELAFVSAEDGGALYAKLKLEGSVFTGREPDEQRTNIESPKMDSWSARVSFNPTQNWALQASYGHLNSPEQLEPEVDTDRATLSAVYNRPLAGGNWQTTLAWGRNMRSPGGSTDAWLLESAVSHGRHTLFGRAERLQNDELIGHTGEIFTVGKVSLGYLYDVVATDTFKTGVGLVGSVAEVPSAIKDVYGDQPLSWMGFFRVRI